MTTTAKKSRNVKVHTTRNGDPADASRGAAVARAKRALGDALDVKLELLTVSQEELRMDLLAKAIGPAVSSAAARERLATATLEELGKWTKAV